MASCPRSPGEESASQHHDASTEELFVFTDPLPVTHPWPSCFATQRRSQTETAKTHKAFSLSVEFRQGCRHRCNQDHWDVQSWCDVENQIQTHLDAESWWDAPCCLGHFIPTMPNFTSPWCGQDHHIFRINFCIHHTVLHEFFIHHDLLHEFLIRHSVSIPRAAGRDGDGIGFAS